MKGMREASRLGKWADGWMKEGALTKTRTKERTCFGEKDEDLVVNV